MNIEHMKARLAEIWNNDITPTLVEYIKIPNESPTFDANWRENGHMDKAVELARAWAAERQIPSLKVEVHRLEDRTPVILAQIPGSKPGNILLYGHLDKQPPFEGWRTEEGLGPWTPVIQGEKLYGRGGADDGYALFASLAAVEVLLEQGIELPDTNILIECSEESGSPDLPAYVDYLQEALGAPDLVVCLDSGCGDYERLWMTTSLRGITVGELRVDVLHEGVHSGDASGVIPSSFRIARELLDRIEDPRTGKILVEELHTEIPSSRVTQAHAAASVLKETVYTKFPRVGELAPMHQELAELILNRTWRPALSVTGQAGMKPLENAGNVLRPQTTLKLSLRLPPTLDAQAATTKLKEVLEADPPYGATVEFKTKELAGDGWHAPETAQWLEDALHETSRRHFGQSACFMGEGGSIPFMGMLGEKFPRAQFVITGVLGPASNAHGPNEFLHLTYAEKLTACVADIIAALASKD